MITPKFLPNGLMDIEDLRQKEEEIKEAFAIAEKQLQEIQAVIHSAHMYNSKLEAENVIK